MSAYNGVPAYQYFHQNANGGVNVKTGQGFLRGVFVGTPGASWLITIQDGQGGPVVMVITPTVPVAFPNLDLELLNGLSVTTSGTTPGDVTISFT
jgi:hypothetical protein